MVLRSFLVFVIVVDLRMVFLLRQGKCGIAVNLIDSEATMQICKDIEEHFGRKISKIDTDNPEEIENIQN